MTGSKNKNKKGRVVKATFVYTTSMRKESCSCNADSLKSSVGGSAAANEEFPCLCRSVYKKTADTRDGRGAQER